MLGTVNPVVEMIAEAHKAGAAVLVDGAQAIAHTKVDVGRRLDADFYAFSSHKMYGPAVSECFTDAVSFFEKKCLHTRGGEMIKTVSFGGTVFADLLFKFEVGTPDFVGIAALAKEQWAARSHRCGTDRRPRSCCAA